MITNYEIFTSSNKPLSDSDISDSLFCNLEINLNDKLVQLESVELLELIALLNKIADTTTYFGPDKYSFELNGKTDYLFKWNRDGVGSTNHMVSVISNEVELVNEKLWTGHFHSTKESFYLVLMKQFIESDLVDFAKKYGNTFHKKHPEIDHKYQIADKVKTVLNENIKTERTGFIISRSHHDKEQSDIYFLMIDGKRYKKMYFERDLELTK